MLGTGEPTVERYRLSVDGFPAAAPVVGIYFDSNGIPLAGYTRALFNDTYTDAPSKPNFLKRFQLTDSNLFVTDYNSSNTNTISGNGDFTVDSFPRPAVGETSTATTYKDSAGSDAG